MKSGGLASAGLPNLNVMTEKDFFARVEGLFIDKERFMETLYKMMRKGAIDLDSMERSFRDVYPIVAAIYKNEIDWYITGSHDKKEISRVKRKMNKMLKLLNA